MRRRCASARTGGLIRSVAGAFADRLVVHGTVGLVLPVPRASGTSTELAVPDVIDGQRQVCAFRGHGWPQAAAVPGRKGLAGPNLASHLHAHRGVLRPRRRHDDEVRAVLLAYD